MSKSEKQLELLHIAGGTLKWYNHSGELVGNFLKS